MPWKDNQEGPWGSKGESNGNSNPGNGKNPWNNRSGKGLDDLIKNAQNKARSIQPGGKKGIFLIVFILISLSSWALILKSKSSDTWSFFLTFFSSNNLSMLGKTWNLDPISISSLS